MRKEAYGVGSIVHVIQRGTRGSPIVHDEDDKNRFLLMLAHFNDVYQPANWLRDVSAQRKMLFERPSEWPKQKKIVNVIAFCLLTNHFHLLLEESNDGGISKYMQRIGTGMSYHYNVKYKQRGSLFQGSFRSRTIDHENYLRYAIAYVQLENALDMYQGRMRTARDFEKAYSWVCNNPYSSLGDHVGVFDRPIVDRKFLTDMFSPVAFRKFGRDFMEGRTTIPEGGEEVAFFE